MPLVPESRRSRQDVKGSIASQFWEQPVHSTKSIDGQLWSLPCEAPALNLTGSSGLSRTQQLLAAQAVGLPLFPSYDGSSEGLVLDRVVAKAGGRRWWTTLSGRIKAQRAYNLAASEQVRKVDAVRDLSNYALCARGHFRLGRRLTLNSLVEAPDAHKLQKRVARSLRARRAAWAARDAAAPAAAASSELETEAADVDGAGGSVGAGAGSSSTAAYQANSGASPTTVRNTSHGSGSSSSGVPELEPCRAHATLRCVLPGHDLSATAGYNLQYLDSTGDVSHVPLAVSLDLASHDRQDGLQYRVGLHQVTAPLSEVPPKPGAMHPWRTSLHAQGALAVEGEAYIWKAAGSHSNSSTGGSSSPSSPGSSSTPQIAEGAGAGASKQLVKSGSGGGTAGSEEEAGGEELRRTKLASALASATAADEDAGVPPRKPHGSPGMSGKQGEAQQGIGGSAVEHNRPANPSPGAAAAGALSSGPAAAAAPHSPVQVSGGSAGSGGGAAGGEAARQQQGHKLEDFMQPLEQLGEQVSGMLHHATHPHSQPHQEEQEQEILGQQAQQQQQQWHQPQDAAISADKSGTSISPAPGPLLSLSSQSITAAIHESVALLQQVRESVERLTGNVQDGSLQRLSQQLVDSRATPQRLRPYSMLLSQPHLKLNAALGCLARMPLPPLHSFTFPHVSCEPLDSVSTTGSSLHTRPASNSSLVSRASYSSQLAEAWQPYFKGTALRVFASAAVSGQLGRFTRPWLDFTAASARVDVGLTSPHVVGVVPDPSTLAAGSSHRPDKHRAFALEGRGAWHALSLSLAQQVYGPVRARMDARFALDPTSVPATEGERSTLKGVLQTALSMRPSLLEAVYGFDCVLPGTEGAARVAVWFSPKRRECMAELRLF